MRASGVVRGAPTFGWELGEMGGWDISPSGFSLALQPSAVGVSTVERRECGPPAWLLVPVCLWLELESTCQSVRP